MQLQQAVNNVFVQLAETLNQLPQQEYVRPCSTLFKNTIGQHVRHIIELYQCLENGYDKGLINYEKRKRDLAIENDKELASALLQEIFKNLSRSNKELVLEACYDEHATQPIQISTNYYREIAYNLEHTIHHMAMIRVGINEVSTIQLPEDFGVASSTVKYRNQCAQ
ncbi:MAG TPA: DinB family protein [Flavitalea sp.]|nr:DinB family protein [Flavitalea sp.]